MTLRLRRSTGVRRPAPRNAWEAVARCAEVPIPWAVAVAVVAIGSVFSVSHDAGRTHVEFHVATVTAVIVALLWLPTLLRVIALTGGNLKTPAGEASTSGFLQAFRDLPPEQQEESLSAAAAVIDRVETQGPPEHRERAREAREEIEEAIAEIPRPPAEVARRLREAAVEYERLRRTMDAGPVRTSAMTQLVSRARGLAATRTPAAMPEQWFGRGDEGARLVAIAAIQAQKDPKQLPIVLDAIQDPRSAFEQFHALRAADELIPALSAGAREDVARALRSQMAENEGEGRWITPADRSRWDYAQVLLKKLEL